MNSLRWRQPALRIGRRHFLAGATGLALGGAAPRRWRIAFANANETPGVKLEGLGFTGADVRRGFELAARTLPVEMIYLDNAGDADRALANADEAIRQKVDLLIEFSPETLNNPEIARRMKAAGIPVLAVGYKIGEAPIYAADNRAAGNIAGQTLGQFAKASWPDETVLAAIVGDLTDPGDPVTLRLAGVIDGLQLEIPKIEPIRLDTGGQPLRAEGLVAKLLAAEPRQKILIAALDDPTALAARAGVELGRRQNDVVIVSQGLDRSVHGGASEKKEIDPTNRGSLVLGSVAYFMDRYGYDVLDLAMKMLDDQKIPALTTTKHVLVSGKNVFREYPPYDMN